MRLIPEERMRSMVRPLFQATWLFFLLLTGCSYPILPITGTSSPGGNQASPSSSPISPAPTSSEQNSLPGSLVPNPAPIPSVIPHETLSPPVEDKVVPASYRLDAIFDYEKHTMTVSETINYVNLSDDTLVDIILVIEPNLWEDGFKLANMKWDSGDSIDDFELTDDQMHIQLPEPLNKGKSLGIRINYQLVLPPIGDSSDSTHPFPYGYTERQTNIVDWYPYIPPYRTGEGWLLHAYWSVGEHQVFDIANFDVKLKLSKQVQNLVIAASALSIQEANSYIYHLEAGRNFAFSLSTLYSVQSIQAGEVTVNSYSFQYDKKPGEVAMQTTASALELFSELLIPYPHKSLSVVEADFPDGMEYDGMYFLSHSFYELYDGTPRGYLTCISVHETAHQWWFGMVGNDQALEPWLDEALSTYMELIYYEKMYPTQLEGMDKTMSEWWWSFRIDPYNPTGWVDSSIYEFSTFRPYRNAVYLLGVKFMDELRHLIGDEQFFSSLKDYVTVNDQKIATAADFIDLARAHTTKDLDGLLARYYKSIK